MLCKEDGPKPLCWKGIEAIVFRTVGDHPTLWESVLAGELQRRPGVRSGGALLDDPAFFTPFVAFFDPRLHSWPNSVAGQHPIPRMGRPSTPMEAYLRFIH